MATNTIEFKPKKEAPKTETREREASDFHISYASEASPDHPDRNEDTGQLIKDPTGERFAIALYDGASKGEGSGQLASQEAARTAKNTQELFDPKVKPEKRLKKLFSQINEAVKQRERAGETTGNVVLIERLPDDQADIYSANVGDGKTIIFEVSTGKIEQLSVDDNPQDQILF